MMEGLDEATKTLIREYDPVQCSDFTVHYRDVSYRLHRFVVIKLSEYFKAALEDPTKNSCTVTKQCSQPGNHCISLENTIGGVDVDVDELDFFFRDMYSEIDCTGKSYQPVRDAFLKQDYPGYCYLSLVSTDPINGTYDLVSYDYNRQHEHKLADSKVSGAYKAKSWIGSDWKCVEPHPNYHLADYFHCAYMLDEYRKQALDIVKLAAKSNIYHAIWRVLVLTDRFQWPDVREACISHCTNDKECGERPAWREITRLLKFETVQEVFWATVKKSPPPAGRR